MKIYKTIIFAIIALFIISCRTLSEKANAEKEYEKLNPLVDSLLASTTAEIQESRLVEFFEGYGELKDLHSELFPISMMYFDSEGRLIDPLNLDPDLIHYVVFIDDYARTRRARSLAFSPFILIPQGEGVRLLLVVE